MSQTLLFFPVFTSQNRQNIKCACGREVFWPNSQTRRPLVYFGFGYHNSRVMITLNLATFKLHSTPEDSTPEEQRRLDTSHVPILTNDFRPTTCSWRTREKYSKASVGVSNSAIFAFFRKILFSNSSCGLI